MSGLDANQSDMIEVKLAKTLESLSTSERVAILSELRTICLNLNIETRLRGLKDVTRLMLGASYWAFQIRAFAMDMTFDDASRKRKWVEVEQISGLPKDDVFKLAVYFESMKPKPPDAES
jgi:hypothetical protein